MLHICFVFLIVGQIRDYKQIFTLKTYYIK